MIIQNIYLIYKYYPTLYDSTYHSHYSFLESYKKKNRKNNQLWILTKF